MVDTSVSSLNQPKKGGKKKILVILVILIIAGLGVFAYRYFNKSQPKEAKPVTSPEPSTTPKPTIDKKSIKIQVQNGTGTPGQASSAVDALTKAGYSAENIKTSNAKTFDASSTTISAKKGFDDVASDIRDALKPTFSDTTIDSTPLDDKSEFDIVIVTGGKKFETATPSASSEATTKPNPTTTTGPTTTSATSTPSPTPTP